MFREYLSEDNIVLIDGTSEGMQVKYRKGDYWYKEDNRGREGLAEYLVSHFLTFTDLRPEEYILYEQGYIKLMRKEAAEVKIFWKKMNLSLHFIACTIQNLEAIWQNDWLRYRLWKNGLLLRSK